ncbi:MAG TPA: dihydrofolate reductase [Micromonosporaceae bacterium]
MNLSLIVAADEHDVIGRGNDLPWHLPEDLRRFKRLTLGHVVVAGRRTHDAIVDRLGRALPGRVTVVVSRRAARSGDGVVYQPDLTSALGAAETIETFANGHEVFIIGGADIYTQTLPLVSRIHLTRVHDRVDGDVRMPAGWLEPFILVEREAPGPQFSFETYQRRR